MKKWLLISLCILSVNFAIAQTPLFKSGFEPNTSIVLLSQDNHYWTFQQTDAQTGYDWKDDIDAIPETSGALYGGLYGNFDNTFNVDSLVEITADPENATNSVLHFEHYTAPVGSARLSAALMFNRDGDNIFQQGYIRQRMYFSKGIGGIVNISNPVDWLVISELFAHDPEGATTARWNINIHKDWGEGEQIYWHVGMEEYQPTRQRIWIEENRDVPIPIEEWFTFEMFFRRGDADNGRIWVAITPENGLRQVVFNITNYTQHTTSPGTLSDWAVFKLYTIQWLAEMMNDKGTPLGVYYDDFEYWDNCGIDCEATNNSCIPLTLYELISEVEAWRTGQRSLEQVMGSIRLWKQGC